MGKTALFTSITLLIAASLSGCAFQGRTVQRHETEPPAQAAVAVPEIKQEEPSPADLPKRPPSAEIVVPDREIDPSGKPYRVGGRTYHPLLNSHGFEERGLASWYGASFHGCRTSSGEIFDMYKTTAAHKLLPMNSKVKVTNVENGKSIVLRVNDRGPFVAGRVIDLSYGAAKRLGIVEKGHARVVVRTEGRLAGQRTQDLSGTFFVHIGAFESRSDSAGLVKDMKILGYRTSRVALVKSDRENESLWRVQMGPYPSMVAAQRSYAKVVRDYPSAFIVAQ
jgi:rare lipoprotein A